MQKGRYPLRGEVEHPDGELARDVRDELSRILKGHRFNSAPKLCQFLSYVVEEVLAGRGEQIKAYSIAVDCFRYPDSFDPQTDPYVRILARRLRRALQSHYSEAPAIGIRIEVPKGSYVPQFPSGAIASEGTPAPLVEIPPLVEGPSIGVFLLEDLTGDKTRQFMATGLTHEFIVNLTHASELRVIGPLGRRGTVDRNHSPTDFELKGTLWRNDDDVRVTARLIETSGGTTVWASNYDRRVSVSRFFEIQDDIARQVVGSIAGRTGAISKTVLKNSSRRKPKSISAYEAALMQYHWSLVFTDEAFARARKALEHAVQSEPGFALAKAMLADSYLSEYICGFDVYENALTRAEELANEATRLDPRCADARWVNGEIHMARGRPTEFDIEFRTALALRPYSSHIRGSYALYLPSLGRWEEALELIRTAIHLCPEHPPWFHVPVFLDYYHREDYLRAYEEALLIRTPGVFWGPLLRACAAGQLGRRDMAKDQVDAILAVQPEFASKAVQLSSTLLRDEGLQKEVLMGLTRAGLDVSM